MRLRKIGVKLLSMTDGSLKGEVAKQLDVVSDFWADNAGPDADVDFNDMVEGVRQRIDTLVAEFGLPTVLGLALKGYKNRAQFTMSLLGHAFSPTQLLTAAAKTGVTLFDNGVPVLVRDEDVEEGDVLSHGQIMSRLPEGGLASVLPDSIDYEVNEVHNLEVGARTSNGADLASDAVLFLTPDTESGKEGSEADAGLMRAFA